MSFQEFKMVSFCIGGRHMSAITKTVSDVTSKGSKVLLGHCSICNGKQTIAVSENTTAAESLGEFLTG